MTALARLSLKDAITARLDRFSVVTIDILSAAMIVLTFALVPLIQLGVNLLLVENEVRGVLHALAGLFGAGLVVLSFYSSIQLFNYARRRASKAIGDSMDRAADDLRDARGLCESDASLVIYLEGVAAGTVRSSSAWNKAAAEHLLELAPKSDAWKA